MQFPSCFLVLLLVACGSQETRVSSDAWAPEANASGHTAPSAATVAANRAAGAALPLDDQRDFVDAERGLLLREPKVVVPSTGTGPDVWDTGQYDFIDGPVPDSVHPSLWRQARLNNLHGLYEVVPGIYQVRGYDLSNMSLVKGEAG